jgi:hypothetical protein
MCVEMLIDFQFIRNLTIGIVVIIKSHYSNYQVTLLLSTTFIRFHSSFLYNITVYVDESTVKFSVCIWTYRSTTHNILCIGQTVESKA